MSVSERRRVSSGVQVGRQRRARVYVSSTYQDLVECRREIRVALQRLGLDDVAMETYTAGEERPLDRCLADVRSADVYIGVLAWRYGFVPDGHDRSITELEYLEAGKAGIPRLMFVLHPDAPWKHSATDRDLTAIEGFRDRVAGEHLCDSFTSVDDLRAIVAEAVGRHLQDEGRFRVDTGTEWAEYCARLVQDYRRLDLEALTPPDRDEHLQIALHDVFVEPDVREDLPDAELPKALLRKLAEAAELNSADLPRGLDRQLVEQARESYGKRATRGAFEALSAPLSRTSVLLGDPGAGKSTLARYVTLALAEGRTGPALAALEGWRPVLIELRDYSLNCHAYETFPAYLDYRKRTDGLGLEQDFLERYLREDGQALVIFDGLDEVFEPRLRQTVARRIAGFAARYPSARVVVTSRVVGYRPRILRDAGFTHYTMQDLNQDRIDRFLRSWYELALHDRPAAAEHRRERLRRAITDSAPIRELAGNPLLLTILAIIGKHQELPRERWKVYEHAARVLVQHWDVNKHLDDEQITADVLREEDKMELLRRLAVRMQEGAHGFAGNSLTEADLLHDIESYLAGRFQYGPAQAADVAAAMVRQLRERNFIFARYGSRIYGFVHRALLEFFAASEIVNRFEKARVLSEEDLGAEIFVRRSEDPAWSEVLRLIAGMVDATVASRLVHRLLDSPGTHLSSALDRQPLAMVALAAQCIAEIRNTNAAAEAAERTVVALIELLATPARSFGGDNRGSHLEKTVLPAFNAVSAWPGRARFREWFDTTGRFAGAAPAGDLGAQFLAALFPGDGTVRDLLHRQVRSAIPDQREAALFALAASWKDDPDTIGVIAERVHDPEEFVRRTALDLMITHWPAGERTREALRYAIADPDPDFRREAVEALARHAAAEPGTRETIMRALRTDSSPAVRSAAGRGLASTWPEHEETRTVLLRACADPSWEVRQAALTTVVARFGGDPGVFPVVLAATRDGDEDVRETAVGLLATRWTDAPESLGAARRAMRDPHYKVRRTGVRVIAQRWPADPAAAAALDRAKSDHQGDVRVSALIARTDPVTAPDEYFAILDAVVAEDPVADARRAALDLLVSEAVESSGAAVARALADPEPAVRAAALRGLSGSIPELPDLFPAVLRLCEDLAGTVRPEAVRAAATFWGHRPEVVAALDRAARAESWQLRRSALESLVALRPGDPRTRRALRQAGLDRAASVRYAALRLRAALGDAGDDYLARVSVDPEGWIRADAATLRLELAGPARPPAPGPPNGTEREAAVYLGAVTAPGDPSAGPALRAAMDDPDPGVRLLAYEVACGRRVLGPDVTHLVRATRDPDGGIRRFGLAALLAGWPDHPETAAARLRGAYDTATEVRRLGLESLILHAPAAPETYEAMVAALGAADWGTRRLALDTLVAQRPGDAETAALLRDRLHHPDVNVREAVMYALLAGWAEDAPTFPAVAERLGDSDAGLRISALRSLAAAWPDDPRTARLVATTRRSLNAEVAKAARELPGTDRRAAEPPAHRSPDPVHRMLSLDSLIRGFGSDADLATACRVSMRDDIPSVRSLAHHALSTRVDDEVAARLLAGAGESREYTLRQVDLDVRRMRWPEAAQTLEAVRRACRDTDPDLRTSSLPMLAELAPETPEAHDTFRAAVADPDWSVRLCAVGALARFWPDDPETRTLLGRACRDYDPDVRRAALELLVLCWPEAAETRRALRDAETDVNDSGREFARQTRIRLYPAEPVEPVTGHAEVVARLSRAADEMPDHAESFDTVRDLAAHPDWAARCDAVDALARRWPHRPETVEVLVTALTDPSDGVRGGALARITEIRPGDPLTFALLRRVALKDPARFLRERALRNLQTWQDDATRELLVRAAVDLDLDGRHLAANALAVGWPDDDATQDVLAVAFCSPLDATRRIAYRWLAMTAPPRRRADLLPAADNAAGLLAAAVQWGDDPEVAALLRERLGSSSDLVRAVSLRGLLLWAGTDTDTAILDEAATDECPAVRQIALAGNDPRRAADPDAWIQVEGMIRRAVGDRSEACGADLLRVQQELGDRAPYELAELIAVWAGAGLLDPNALLANDAGAHLSSADRDWLSWLAATE